MSADSPPPVLDRPVDEVTALLEGFPPPAVQAGERLTEPGSGRADFDRALALLLLCHQPQRGAGGPKLEPLPTMNDRLREDIGLDSLALAEAAFLCDELFSTQLDTREIAQADTLGELADMVWVVVSGGEDATP